MDKSLLWGIIAQCFTSVAGVLYLIRTFQGINKLNLISWTIWSFIGWAFFLVTVNNPEADKITKIFSVILAVSPTSIAFVALKKGTIESVSREDIFAVCIALVAMVVWFYKKDEPGIIPVLLAILADICALIPTLRFVYGNPADDRPGAWFAFSFGSLLTLLSLQKWNPESYLLPMYMGFASLLVVYPLFVYRIRNKITDEWI